MTWVGDQKKEALIGKSETCRASTWLSHCPETRSFKGNIIQSGKHAGGARGLFALGFFVEQAGRAVGHARRLKNFRGLWSLSPLRRGID